jgi:hypothetical protein
VREIGFDSRGVIDSMYALRLLGEVLKVGHTRLVNLGSSIA